MNKLKSAFATFVIIFLKELKHAFRDKDVVIYTIVVPAVLYPLLLVMGIEVFVMKQEADQKETITYAIVDGGGEKVKIIDQLLAKNKRYKKVESANPRAELFAGKINMLLHEVAGVEKKSARLVRSRLIGALGEASVTGTPASATDAPASAKVSPASATGIPASATSLPAPAPSAAPAAKETMVEALVPRSTADIKIVDNLNKELRDNYKQALNQAFKEKGLGPSALEIDKVEQENVNKQKKEVFSIGLALLFFSLFNVALGAAYPAISATSEEFERNSIEATLMLPVDRWFFLSAKLAAVVVLALLAGSLNLFSMYGNTSLVTLGGGPAAIIDQLKPDFRLTPAQIPAVTVAYLATAFIYASVLMMTAAFCRTVRSSQQWVSLPLTIFIFLPFVAIIPQVELTYTTASIPVLGNILTLRSLFNGDHLTNLHAITLIEAVILVAVATKIASVLVFERFEGQWRF